MYFCSRHCYIGELAELAELGTESVGEAPLAHLIGPVVSHHVEAVAAILSITRPLLLYMKSSLVF